MGTLSGRIFRNIFLTAVVVVLLAYLLVAGLVYAVLDSQMRRELLNTIDVIEEALAVVTEGAEATTTTDATAGTTTGAEATAGAGAGTGTTVDATTGAGAGTTTGAEATTGAGAGTDATAGAEASYLQRLELRDIRVTWIAADGLVLHDSVVAESVALENHLDRPEVRDALQNGSGTASRHSETLGEETVYLARLLPDGTVLRVAGTQKSVLGHMGTMLVPVLLILGVVALMIALIARFTSRRILKPLSDIDFDQPLENETYPELSPLLTRLNVAHRELAERNTQLDAREREFDVVTDSMKEGLVLADANGQVLFINAAAARLFDAISEEVVGRHLLALNRSAAMQQVVEAALSGKRAEGSFRLEGRIHQVLASPVLWEGEPRGAAFLLLDITEQYLADIQRREFSANVTHELKTPLTVINGYAELMEKGMVQQENVERISHLIHDEAGRLIVLIDDIITLSQLDEQEERIAGSVVFEKADLFTLAREVTERLADFARSREVTLTLLPSKADVEVSGMRALLYRMLYNLVENGIRYTDAGGEVSVEVIREEGKVTVSVRDSGIGIPESFHEKVFERFFRVDSSRSKETGGTGLGLAIVKHGALLHNATIDLRSAEGLGTTMKLHFDPFDGRPKKTEAEGL
jgi:two-component system phosphate regulon sensor histidine kinase PhoR